MRIYVRLMAFMVFAFVDWPAPSLYRQFITRIESSRIPYIEDSCPSSLIIAGLIPVKNNHREVDSD